MSTKTRTNLIRAAVFLGAGGLMIAGLAPSASAAQADDVRVAQAVTVTINQQGNYTAALCVGDILEARCVDGVRRGQTRTFTVNPPANSPVSVRLLVNGGGSADADVVTGGNALRFQTGGSAARPTIVRR